LVGMNVSPRAEEDRRSTFQPLIFYVCG